ncbi:hypothetical protein [Treponema sp. R80B11-R83G3]
MRKAALIIFPVILLLSACALEIANVIGPGGGYVYYDKGNYKGGWRYKECSPFDIGELKDTGLDSLEKAVKLCIEQSDDWYAYNWEIPDEADMKKLLECFSYGLTRFSPDYYYLSANKTSHYDPSAPNSWDPKTWTPVIFHKSFESKLNGEVEKVDAVPKDFTIRIRPIRKF